MPQGQPKLLQPDHDGIAEAAALLSDGELVAMPTETVYGLAADARNGDAVARVFEAKGRPSFNPLIVHLPDAGSAAGVAHLEGAARDLAQAFWPGPPTLVLPLRPGHGLSSLVSAGLDTVAVRVPAHPVAQALLRAFGGPLAAPSANPSGRISPTRPAHVVEGLGQRVAAVLDGGPCEVGVESTILRASAGEPVTLLREGGLPAEAIETMTGAPLSRDTTPGRVSAPGQLESHYAPAASLEMDSALTDETAVRVGFGPASDADLNLSPGGDLREAAASLFDTLHAADRVARESGRSRIAVAPVSEKGLGRAINDRLRRAAAPRG